MNGESFQFFEFGRFRVNVADRLLERDRELVPLTPKVFDTLLLLIERRGHLVEKNDLMELLWPDTFVEESSLTQNISLLRKALGDLGAEHQYIETIPRRGYRFIAPVQQLTVSASELILQENNRTEILIEERVEMDYGLGQIVRNSLSRFASAVRGYPRLTRIAITAGMAASLILAVLFVVNERQSERESVEIRSIAVLPFTQLGGDTSHDVIGVGIADALILKLSNLDRVTVLPTSSVVKYMNREKDVLATAKELGVNAVVDGSFQQDGTQVRVTAHLIRSDGKTLWSAKFDEQYRSNFSLQDSVSDQLARNLMAQLQKRPTTTIVRRITEDNDAYQAYLTGLYFWNRRNRENLVKAIEYFEQAVAKDPNFALAHSLLADCYYLVVDGGMGIPKDVDTLKRVREETARALELDNNLAEAHTVRAGLALIDNDAATADREFRLALELNPNYAVAHLRYGYFLFGIQRLHEANAQMLRAQELDPASPVTNAARGFMLYMSRDYDSAVNCYRKSIELQPESVPARFNLGLTYVTKGMFREGLEEFQRLESTDDVSATKGKIWAYGQAGRKADAQKFISKLEQSKDKAEMMPIDYVFMYAAVGEKDKAFEWLEKVSLEGLAVARLKFEPQLDVLRADVRFAQYLSRHHNELLPPQLSS